MPRIDLSAVQFMDSTGIGALIALRNHAEDAGHKLILRRPSRPVMRILDITDLATMFLIENAQGTSSLGANSSECA